MQEVIRSQIRLPKNIHQNIKTMADENGISMNQFIIDSLNEKLMKRACSPSKVKQALELITFALEQNNHE